MQFSLKFRLLLIKFSIEAFYFSYNPDYLVKKIEKFFENRTFRVKVGNFTSITRSISCSVPQGGLLSHTLFRVYINDVPVLRDKNKRNYLPMI